MHVPRFIILSFIGLLLASMLTATALLASGSEPELGDSIVVTPLPVPGPPSDPSSTGSPKATAPKTAGATASPKAPAMIGSGAVPVPPCVVIAGSDDDCDDDDDGDDADDADDAELDDLDDNFDEHDSPNNDDYNNRYRYGYKQYHGQN